MADDDTLLDAAARIVRSDHEHRYAEADELLDRARANHDLLFRADRFRYAALRARLAARRGRAGEAAAFARGALWQAGEDEDAPQFSRHPGVGRVRADRKTRRELERYAEAGDAERYDALVDDYRAPDGGCVQWHWSLVERLRPNPAIVGRHDAEVETSRRAAQPLLLELRAAGFAAYDLFEFADRRPTSKAAATILVSWLARITDPLTRSGIAMALTDPKARAVATRPLLDLFRGLPDGAREKDRVAAALATLARDAHFEPVAELVRDPAHGHYRAYLFSAVGYMKDPRAVDLCAEFLADPGLDVPALQALADLRSVRARPLLEGIASEPATRGRGDAAQRQRDRVRIAQGGLEKLSRALAAGMARP